MEISDGNRGIRMRRKEMAKREVACQSYLRFVRKLDKRNVGYLIR